MKDIEHRSQVQLCKWLDAANIRYYAIPNGGARTAKTGKRLKDEGVKAGMPDLHLFGLRLYIEMKSPTGRLSPAQVARHKELREAGYRVEVCHSAEEAIKLVEGFRL
jgi:hypothetical protein